MVTDAKFQQFRTKFIESIIAKNSDNGEEELEQFRQETANATFNDIACIAACENDVSAIEFFIKEGDNPYFVDEDGNTILNLAAESGSLDVINYLLDNNIFTVDQRASENSKTPFHSAVEEYNIEAAELLLKKGADINAVSLISVLLPNGDRAIEEKTALYTTIHRAPPADEESELLKHGKIFKLLLKHGAEIKYDNEIPDKQLILNCPFIFDSPDSNSQISKLAFEIKSLEDLYIVPNGNFINTYESSSPAIQEIWRDRLFNNDSSKIQDLAEFIAEKFINDDVIEYNEYGALRKYTSFIKPQKDLLKILLESKGFNKSNITELENYIQDHFLKMACIGKDLTGSAFEKLDQPMICGITQYLQFEDSSIKIAGANSENNIDGDHS